MIRSSRRPAVSALLALVALTGGAATTLLDPAPAVAADEIDTIIAELKELDKAGDKEEPKLIGRIVLLEEKNDPRLTAYITSIAKTSDSDKLVKVAIAYSSKKKDDALFSWLKGKAGDDKYMEKHEERYFAVLEAMARYSGDKVKDARKDLEDITSKFLGFKGGGRITSKTIPAYARIREKATIDQLLKWLQETEKTSGGQGGKALGQDTKDAYAAAKAAILRALRDMTTIDLGDWISWNTYWEGNKKTYQFPSEDQGEPDYATIKEWTHPVYRFTIKKPDVPFWVFKKSDVPSGGHVNLEYIDDKGMLWARIRIASTKTWDTASNPEQFAKYYAKEWQEKDFEQISKGPDITPKKMGKNEFQVLTAKGLGKDSWKGWDSCERRYYVAMPLPKSFLYFEVSVRNAAEEPVKAALWAAIDGIVWK